MNHCHCIVSVHYEMSPFISIGRTNYTNNNSENGRKIWNKPPILPKYRLMISNELFEAVDKDL